MVNNRNGKGKGRSTIPAPTGTPTGSTGRNPTLRPVTMPIGGGGFAGSNSRGALHPSTQHADPLADMAGFVRAQHRQIRPPAQMGSGTGFGSGFGSQGYVPHMGFMAQTGYMSTGSGGDAHADDYFSEHQADMLVRTPQTPQTPHTPHTPQTNHHSVDRGMSTGHDSNAGDFHHNLSLPLIRRNGDRFGDSKVHAAAITIFWESMDDAWPNYTNIPASVLSDMFGRFGTVYRWDPNEHEAVFVGFKNTLKERYRDRMAGARKKSGLMARKAGHLDVPVDYSSYLPIMREFRPDRIPESVWPKLCDHWSTEEWQNLSKSGRKNRNTADVNGKTSRHTGGSIGNAEHRKRLEAMLGREPTWFDVYMQTHGTAESKRRYFAGDRSNLQFISGTAHNAHDAFLKALAEKYGEDPANHKDDAELWVESELRRKGGKRRVTCMALDPRMFILWFLGHPLRRLASLHNLPSRTHRKKRWLGCVHK